MLMGNKRFSRKGRFRFGSEIFIDDTYETMVDTLSGSKRNNSIPILAIWLTLVNLLTANFIGFFFMAIMFYFTYFFADQEVKIHFTKKRLFKITSLKKPRLVRFLAYFYFGMAIFVTYRFFYPEFLDYTITNLAFMAIIFDLFKLIPIFYFSYFNFILSNEIFLIRFDAVISFIVYLWYGLQLYFSKFSFEETHYSHVSEQLITLINPPSFGRTSVLILIILVPSFAFNTFSLPFVLIILIINSLIPGEKIAAYSLFGPNGTVLVNKIQLSKVEFPKCIRVVASIFDWIPQGNYEERDFPNNLIPLEVASHYQTGLRASLITALRQGNLFGLIVVSIINTIVLYVLFNFAIFETRGNLNFVIVFSIILILFTASFWYLLNQTNKQLVKLQKEESLIIGPRFIGRYIEPKLWIIKGNRLEGTRLQRGSNRSIVSYDRSTGFVIAWGVIIIYFGIILSILSLGLWISLGGLNIANAVYIFPFIFDQSITFLIDKANTALGFFIIFGFIFWLVIYFNYPRFFSLSRPQLFLEMQFPSRIPIILKDYSDHQDASYQFTKCLINSSRPTRRSSTGRPGTYILDIYMKDCKMLKTSDDTSYYFLFEDINRKSEIYSSKNLSKLNREKLISGLKSSGILGIPKIKISLMSINLEITKLEKQINYELKNDSFNSIEFFVEDVGIFNLVAVIKDAKF